MIWHYFVTLDKTLGLVKPTLEEFLDILIDIKLHLNLHEIYPHRVHSVEMKQKGSIRNNTKVHDWPHYHCILNTSVHQPLYKYNKYRKYGWSIQFKFLQYNCDVARTAGYIYKHVNSTKRESA